MKARTLAKVLFSGKKSRRRDSISEDDLDSLCSTFKPALAKKSSLLNDNNDNGSDASSVTDPCMSSQEFLPDEDDFSEDERSEGGRRRVRFCPTTTTIYPKFDVLTAEDCQNIWWSAKDYENFKKATAIVAKTLNRAEMIEVDDKMSQGNILLQLHKCAATDCPCKQQQDHGTWLDACYAQSPCYCCLASHETRRYSNALFGQEDDQDAALRVGLERTMVASLHRDKYQRRVALNQMVFDVQEYAKLYITPKEEEQQELARECAKISQASRYFAQYLAQASVGTL